MRRASPAIPLLAALSVSNLVWRANKVVRSGNYRPWKRRTFSFWHCEAVDSDADGK